MGANKKYFSRTAPCVCPPTHQAEQQHQDTCSIIITSCMMGVISNHLDPGQVGGRESHLAALRHSPRVPCEALAWNLSYQSISYTWGRLQLPALHSWSHSMHRAPFGQIGQTALRPALVGPCNWGGWGCSQGRHDPKHRPISPWIHCCRLCAHTKTLPLLLVLHSFKHRNADS